MVKLMLDGFGGDRRVGGEEGATGPVVCYHVNSRVSSGMEDIGEMRVGKLLSIVGYCLEAIWCRFRHGVDTFYYVPAPGKRSALYRDWVVLSLCRPFFHRFILHWHAVGLSEWLGKEANWVERRITRWLFRHIDLGVALAIPSMYDPLWFEARQVAVVPNGIPDPCPDCEERLLPRRLARPLRRLLYLAHCTREKGLFDTLEALALYNQRHPDAPLELTVAGAFLEEAEEQEFRTRIAQGDLASAVHYAGFVHGDEKVRLLEESDALCFPTYYRAEGQPVNLIEAMAFGLPIITTRWRAIPEILPADYPLSVPPQNPEKMADALEALCALRPQAALRAEFTRKFTLTAHLDSLLQALRQSRVRPKVTRDRAF